jgi:hypothetical protein
LEKLQTSGKIVRSHDGTYDIKFSPEEMQTLTPLEEKVFHKIDKDNEKYSDGDDLYSYVDDLKSDENEDITKEKLDSVLRALKIKDKIFKNKENNYYYTYESPEKSKILTTDEAKIIDHFRHWPVNNWRTIKKATGMVVSPSMMLSLQRKRLIFSPEYKEYELNTKLVSPYPDAIKDLNYFEHNILEVLKHHYVTVTSELSHRLVYDHYDEIIPALESLKMKGIVQYINNRYLVAGYNYKETPEEKAVFQAAQKPAELEHVIGRAYAILMKNLKEEAQDEDKGDLEEVGFADGFASTHVSQETMQYILNDLVEKKKIRQSQNPINGETIFYSAKGPEYKQDTSKYDNKIVEVLKRGPKTRHQIKNFLGESYGYIPSSGFALLLDELIKQGKIKKGEDFALYEVFYVPENPPKSLEEWKKIVLQLLEEKPVHEDELSEKLVNQFGLHGDAVVQLLHNMKDEEIDRFYNPEVGDYSYRIMGKHQKDYSYVKDAIVDFVAKEPSTRQEIMDKVHEAFPEITDAGVHYFLSSLTNEEPPRIQKTVSIIKGDDEVYHVANVDPQPEATEFIMKQLEKVPTSASDFVDMFYSNFSTEVSGYYIEEYLNELVRKHKIEHGKNAAGYWVYYLKTNAPKSLEWYKDELKKILAEKPLSRFEIEQKMGVDIYMVNQVLDSLYYDSSQITRYNDPLSGNYKWKLKSTPMPDFSYLENAIKKALQLKPINDKELYAALTTQGINITQDEFVHFVSNMQSKGQVETERDAKSGFFVYHLPGISINAQYEKEIVDWLMSKPEHRESFYNARLQLMKPPYSFLPSQFNAFMERMAARGIIGIDWSNDYYYLPQTQHSPDVMHHGES